MLTCLLNMQDPAIYKAGIMEGGTRNGAPEGWEGQAHLSPGKPGIYDTAPTTKKKVL